MSGVQDGIQHVSSPPLAIMPPAETKANPTNPEANPEANPGVKPETKTEQATEQATDSPAVSPPPQGMSTPKPNLNGLIQGQWPYASNPTSR